MTVISKDGKVIELINVITVEPEHQQAIVDNVREILRDVAKKQPGFISAKVHKSLDGTRVAYFIVNGGLKLSNYGGIKLST